MEREGLQPLPDEVVKALRLALEYDEGWTPDIIAEILTGTGEVINPMTGEILCRGMGLKEVALPKSLLNSHYIWLFEELMKCAEVHFM